MQISFQHIADQEEVLCGAYEQIFSMKIYFEDYLTFIHIFLILDMVGLSKAARSFLLGDQEMCYDGSCEFFLMCWLGGGLIEGGCGGFLFACCKRGHRGGRGASFRDASHIEYSPRNYGPIRNDPSIYLLSLSEIVSSIFCTVLHSFSTLFFVLYLFNSNKFVLILWPIIGIIRYT